MKMVCIAFLNIKTFVINFYNQVSIQMYPLKAAMFIFAIVFASPFTFFQLFRKCTQLIFSSKNEDIPAPFELNPYSCLAQH